VGTIQAQSILSKASAQLVDEDAIRWPLDELLGYLNEGQRSLVIVRPEAGTARVSQRLVAGTAQSIPPGAHTLLDIPRNMGADGSTPGNAIRVVSREVLDAIVPNWHQAKASSVVSEFMFDPRNPTAFYVSPPQPATNTGYVELVIARNPADVPAVDQPITIDDVYAPALLDYVLYRAYSKDSEFGGEAALSVQHYNTFMQSIGGFTNAQMLRSPNLMPTPFNPQLPAAAR
jgi:hypothetical protein